MEYPIDICKNCEYSEIVIQQKTNKPTEVNKHNLIKRIITRYKCTLKTCILHEK